MEKRTLQQNRALHKYLSNLSDALNEAGLDQRKVLKPSIQIPWTPESAKSFLWHPIQEAMFNKESTAELDRKQVSEVYEVLNRHLAEKFGVTTGFPSEEDK